MRTMLLALVLVVAVAGIAAADDWFADDFNDGAIDPGHWVYGGAITESAGYLNLDREDPGDYIQTVSTYSGDFVVDVDIRLDVIRWNDMFHGISITDDTGTWGAGVSFGYSMYGKLYLGVHAPGGGGMSYYYGPAGSNQPGVWQHWTIENTGTDVIISVNGTPITWGPAPGTIYLPDGVTIRMPGFYEDGDGGAHIGLTSSDVDAFSVAPTGMTSVGATADHAVATWGGVKDRFSPSEVVPTR
jgi:hypothetical protein